MTKQKILNTFKKFRRLSDSKRQRFFSAFEEKMIYRTTKTESPETTVEMIKEVLDRCPAKT